MGEEFEALIEERVAAEIERRLAIANGAAQSPYLSVLEAADFLRCSRQRVDDLLSQRRLRRFKDGARTLIRRDELEAYIQERR